MKLPVYNSAGEKVKELELSERIFGIKPKIEVIHQVVIAQLANRRQVLAHTKDKGEVRGGGKKPWRQKGTGRARHGSIRSPLWRGGGITFGPTKERNFAQKVNKKQKQLALLMCLSDKAAQGTILIFNELSLKEIKTKLLNHWIQDIKTKIKGLSKNKKVLLILDKNDQNIIRAAMNLKDVNTILADSLNCVEILKSNMILTSEKAIGQIEAHYKRLK